MSKKRKLSDSDLQEKIVAILEQSLDESANVEQNVQMPVLDSKSGRTRQCDVVIWQGNKPRQILTIVETQKRGRKPDINTFGGWVEKKREVGAHQLICVSQVGFPSSVIEAAEAIGPAVRLMTLKNLEEHGSPFPSSTLSPQLDVTEYVEITGLQVHGHHLFKVKNMGVEASDDPNDAVFKAAQTGRLLSAADVADWRLFSNPTELRRIPADGNEHGVQIEYEWQDWGGLHFQQVGGGFVPIKKLIIQMKLKRHTTNIDWTFAEYVQTDWEHGVGWVLKGKGVFNGKPVAIVIPVRKQGNAMYSLDRPHVIGDFDAFMEMGSRVIRAARHFNE